MGFEIEQFEKIVRIETLVTVSAISNRNLDVLQHGHGQKQNKADNEGAVNQLKILRRRNSDGVVDAVKDDDAEDRSHHRRCSPEQRENDRENGELAAEYGFGVEHRGVPGKHTAGEARDQRAQ